MGLTFLPISHLCGCVCVGGVCGVEVNGVDGSKRVDGEAFLKVLGLFTGRISLSISALHGHISLTKSN